MATIRTTAIGHLSARCNTLHWPDRIFRLPIGEVRSSSRSCCRRESRKNRAPAQASSPFENSTTTNPANDITPHASPTPPVVLKTDPRAPNWAKKSSAMATQISPSGGRICSTRHSSGSASQGLGSVSHEARAMMAWVGNISAGVSGAADD
ncbi:MAG: hypothetical protein NTX51_13335 [Verrucomicrobia bacterium]|nr:hypothetical protein [Verrucomicrobiota bacterium]